LDDARPVLDLYPYPPLFRPFESVLLLDQLPQQFDVVLRDLSGEQTGLSGVAAEDVGETGRDHDPESVIRQRPHGVLTRGAGAEIRSGDENAAAIEGRSVEHEGRVVAPCGEQTVLESRTGDALQVHGRDDLIRVDIGAAQRDADALVSGEGFHRKFSSSVLWSSPDPPVRKAFPAPRLRRPRPARRDASVRPCPAVLRNSGSRSTRSVRPAPTGRGSCPGTSSTRPDATRRLRR